MIDKDVYWFHHDSNARHDPKLTQLKIRHGMAAVGIWWNVVEMLREAADNALPKDEATVGTIAYEGMTTPEEAKALIEYAVSLGLLQESESHFWAPALNKRQERWRESKERRSEQAKKAAEARHHGEDADAMLEQCGSNAAAMPEQCSSMPTYARREEERREEKKKTADAEHPSFDVPMNQTRYDNLCEEHGQDLVDWAVGARIDWEASNGKKAARDYAAAAAGWIAKAKEFGKLPRLPPREKRCPECGEPYLGYMCVSCGWEQPA